MFRKRNVFILIILVLVILLLVWWFLVYENVDDVDKQAGDKGADDIEDVVKPKKKFIPIERPENDRDFDGIPDNDEEELGTSSLDSDTDGDGLGDYAEVNKWHTDPTKIDTDGDGFTDTIELMNGYNPLGSGKLK